MCLSLAFTLQYDDPNATISGILDELRQLGHTPDFPPSKLKSGSGEHCIWVIDRLADAALTSKGFTWRLPVYPEEEADEENIIEDDAELTLNQVEKELIAEEIEEDFEEEENILGLDDLKNLGAKDLVRDCKSITELSIRDCHQLVAQ